MKKKMLISILVLVLLLGVLFFPIKSVKQYSGVCEVENKDGAVIGTAQLEVTVHKTASLLQDYSRSFTFTADGVGVDRHDTASVYDMGDGRIVISQLYYDAAQNQYESCGLVYTEDGQKVIVRWMEQSYRLTNEE